MYILDTQYRVNPNWAVEFHFMKNKSPLVKMQNMPENDGHMLHRIKKNDTSIDLAISLDGNVFACVEQRLAKNFSAFFNINWNPLLRGARTNNFSGGFGLRFDVAKPQDLMQIEEDMSEFEYENL